MPMEPHPTIASQPVGCGLLDQLNEQKSMLKKHGKKSGKSTTYDSWVIPTSTLIISYTVTYYSTIVTMSICPVPTFLGQAYCI